MKFPLFIVSIILSIGALIVYITSPELDNVFIRRLATSDNKIPTATLTTHQAAVATSTKEIHIPIFIYHSVRPYRPGESTDQDIYDITPELLDRQLEYLTTHGYTTITLDELVDIVNNRLAISHPVLLTFDDGLQNQYEYAFPLLKKYSVTGTFYVYSHAMDVNPHFMTWAELKEMDHAGMSIESHSVTHPYLHTLTPEELHSELMESKNAIEQHLGKTVHHFAAPFGYIDDEVSAEAAKDGYQTARAIAGFKPITSHTLLHLPGVIVSDSFEQFVKALSY